MIRGAISFESKCLKSSINQINSNKIFLSQIGTDVASAAKNKDPEFRQPFLLALGEPRKPHQYFLVLDKTAVDAGTNTVVAFDRLFKSHYLFGIDFSPVLKNFWEFIASVIYEVLPAVDTKASVRSLALAITNLS